MSVRVTIIHTARGRLAGGIAEYPLHRRKDLLITQRREMITIPVTVAVNGD